MNALIEAMAAQFAMSQTLSAVFRPQLDSVIFARSMRNITAQKF